VRLFANDVAGPAAAVVLGAILDAAAAGLRGGHADYRKNRKSGESCGEKENFYLGGEDFHLSEPLGAIA
jgi:hypothetical protein